MRRVVAGWLLFLACLAPPCRAEKELLGNEAAGRVPVTTEKTVVVRGISGDISVEQGSPGELLFHGAEVDDRNRLAPVAAWIEGTAVLLTPVEGEPPRPRNLLLTVPPGMGVRVESSDARIVVAGLADDLDVAGARLDVEVYSCQARVGLDVKGGSARVDNLGGDATVRGSDLDLRMTNVQGKVSIYLTGKIVALKGLQSSIDGDITGVDWTLDESEGPLNLTSRHGTVYVSALRRGAAFELTESPLRYFESQGDTTIHADADVQLRETSGAHRLDLSGGTLRVADNTGSLEIAADSTELLFEHLTGPLKVQGRRSGLRLSELTGDLTVEATASDTTVEKASGTLTIGADGGNVRVDRANGSVDVQSRGGEVRVLNHSGSAKVRGDGRSVEVSWISNPAGKDSLVQNDGGDVTVRFLGGAGGHVTATAPSGRIDTDLERLTVDRSGSSAEGFVGSAQQPTVVVRSSGNIDLTGTDAPPDQETGR